MHKSKTYWQLLSSHKSWHSNLLLQRYATTKQPKILLEECLEKNPFCLFYDWWQQALEKHKFWPRTASLATVDCEGKPANRVMTLRDLNDQGFIIDTCPASRKALHIADNPNVSLLFFWSSHKRYVEIQGVVEKIPDQQYEPIFRNRPRDNQIVHSLPQSSVVPSRSYLEDLEQQLRSKLKENEPVPINWAGYIVKPHTMEFCQGQHYLYDKFRFRRGENVEKEIDGKCVHKAENGWVYERLAP